MADGKGRFVIPASMRNLVKEHSEEARAFFSMHERYDCATGFGKRGLDKIAEGIDRDERNAIALGRDFDRADAMQRRMGIMDDAVFDAGGRFTLPSYHKSEADIDDMIFFIGAGDNFEMWNPERLMETDGVNERLKSACRHALAEWKANPRRGDAK